MSAIDILNYLNNGGNNRKHQQRQQNRRSKRGKSLRTAKCLNTNNSKPAAIQNATGAEAVYTVTPDEFLFITENCWRNICITVAQIEQSPVLLRKFRAMWESGTLSAHSDIAIWLGFCPRFTTFLSRGAQELLADTCINAARKLYEWSNKNPQRWEGR